MPYVKPCQFLFLSYTAFHDSVAMKKISISDILYIFLETHARLNQAVGIHQSLERKHSRRCLHEALEIDEGSALKKRHRSETTCSSHHSYDGIHTSVSSISSSHTDFPHVCLEASDASASCFHKISSQTPQASLRIFREVPCYSSSNKQHTVTSQEISSEESSQCNRQSYACIPFLSYGVSCVRATVEDQRYYVAPAL